MNAKHIDIENYKPKSFVMMKSKSGVFGEKDIERLAKRFKILSEPSRLKILRSLFNGEKCVSEIIDTTGMLQANVSKQLKILQKDGILSCRASGLQRYYTVLDPTILHICSILCGHENNTPNNADKK